MACKKSVYLSGNADLLLTQMQQETGKSASEIISIGIREAALQHACRLRISEGAYAVLSAADYGYLQHTKLENGVSLLSLREDAYRNPDGSRGPFADRKDTLCDYIREGGVCHAGS